MPSNGLDSVLSDKHMEHNYQKRGNIALEIHEEVFLEHLFAIIIIIIIKLYIFEVFLSN